MPHPTGTHLGGIRTVEDLRLRCRVDEDTGCWHWGLSISQGAPKVHLVTPDTGVYRIMRGRRAALYLQRGHDLRPQRYAFARPSCTSIDCVNPEHCRSGSRAQHGAWLRASGRVKDLPTKAAAARRGWDKRGRKITPEQAAEIRISDESAYAIAARLGLSHYAVWSVRAGHTHKPAAPGRDVFTWAQAAPR